MNTLDLFFALQLDRVMRTLRQPHQTFSHPVQVPKRSRKATAQQQYYARRKAQGFCRTCWNAVPNGQTRCAVCRAKHNRAQRHTGTGRRFFHRARGEAA